MLEIHYVCSGSCGAVLSEQAGISLQVCSSKGCTMQSQPLIKKYFCTRHQVHLTQDELAEHKVEQD